jgi:hypothetical protein
MLIRSIGTIMRTLRRESAEDESSLILACASGNYSAAFGLMANGNPVNTVSFSFLLMFFCH